MINICSTCSLGDDEHTILVIATNSNSSEQSCDHMFFATNSKWSLKTTVAEVQLC
jgi:hypothetical protein